MRYFYYTPLAFILLLLVPACGEWFLPPLEVVSLSTDGEVRIVFSAQPSDTSIKQAFSMSEDGKQLSGSFGFQDQTVIFRPVNGLRDYCEYKISISTVAEDTKGNSLLHDFEHVFYTKQDLETPAVISVTPADESSLALQPHFIGIGFSEPVDRDSFARALNISPAFAHVLNWNAGSSAVEIIPVKPLSEGSRYTLTISTELRDLRNNHLLNPFTSTFLYGLDKNKPVISLGWETEAGLSGVLTAAVPNGNIPSDCELVLTFDKRIAIDSIAGYIDISPSISRTVIPDLVNRNTARVIFNNTPEWNKPYTIKIKQGITDTFGNKTDTDTDYVIVCNHEKDRPVTFLGGALNIISEWKKIDRSTDYSELTLNVVDFPISTDKTTVMLYAFRISSEADALSLISAMQAVSISTGNSCAYISIRTMRIMTQAEYVASPLYAMVDNTGKICALEIGLEIENSDNSGLITFTIREGIADSLLNTMIETQLFTLNKQ
jgi:hypothetical protein